MVRSTGGVMMIIEFTLRSRYNGKRFMPGQQANIPEDVAKRLVNSGAAFFIEKKEILEANGAPKGDPPSKEADSDEVDFYKLLDKKFTLDELKEVAMEEEIVIPSFKINKGPLIELIIEENKAEEVLAHAGEQ